MENHNGYKQIGSACQENYRDYPAPGVAYYYAVVAVNDLGESDHYSGDTDGESVKVEVDLCFTLATGTTEPGFYSNSGVIYP